MKRKGDMGIEILRNIIFALLVIGVLIGLYMILGTKIKVYAQDIPKQLVSLFL